MVQAGPLGSGGSELKASVCLFLAEALLSWAGLPPHATLPGRPHRLGKLLIRTRLPLFKDGDMVV